jgi:hypothetical protein
MTDFHRTNINLLQSDVDWLQHNYGYGWTEKVREIIHGYITGMDEPEIANKPIFEIVSNLTHDVPDDQ